MVPVYFASSLLHLTSSQAGSQKLGGRCWRPMLAADRNGGSTGTNTCLGEWTDVSSGPCFCPTAEVVSRASK